MRQFEYMSDTDSKMSGYIGKYLRSRINDGRMKESSFSNEHTNISQRFQSFIYKTEIFDLAGRDGWELVSVDAQPGHNHYLFKREITPEPVRLQQTAERPPQQQWDQHVQQQQQSFAGVAKAGKNSPRQPTWEEKEAYYKTGTWPDSAKGYEFTR